MNYELWISPCHLACGGVKQVASEPVAEQQGVSWKHPSEELDHREYHQECHLHHRHCFSHPESEYGLGPKVHHPHHQDPFCFSSPFLWWMAGVLRFFFGFLVWSTLTRRSLWRRHPWWQSMTWRTSWQDRIPIFFTSIPDQITTQWRYCHCWLSVNILGI